MCLPRSIAYGSGWPFSRNATSSIVRIIKQLLCGEWGLRVRVAVDQSSSINIRRDLGLPEEGCLRWPVVHPITLQYPVTQDHQGGNCLIKVVKAALWIDVFTFPERHDVTDHSGIDVDTRSDTGHAIVVLAVLQRA